MSDIVAAAEAKRARIIEREGDLNGIRRDPRYLYQLIAEEAAFRDMVQGIKKEAVTTAHGANVKLSRPQPTMTIVS